MRDPVIIVDFDPHWVALYEEERRVISGAIGEWLAGIEHIGSTSVPGLAAKPIIDIMAGVRSLDDALHCIAPLAALGYRYRPEYELEMPERRYFNKGPQGAHRHLHMVELGGAFWRDHLLFRDYLRTHPETAAAYAALKRGLATQYGRDRDGYTDAKTEFIKAVVRAARDAAAP